MENPNLTRQQEGGGRKQWCLMRSHNCHRTLHNTLFTRFVSYFTNIFTLPKPWGFVPVNTVMPSVHGTAQDHIFFFVCVMLEDGGAVVGMGQP